MMIAVREAPDAEKMLPKRYETDGFCDNLPISLNTGKVDF